MFELSGWVLFGAVAIWFFMLYRHSHSKRLHLNCYIIFLLLHDEFRAKQKQDLEVWLRENSASNALALSHAAYMAIEELADRLAAGDPKKSGEGSLVLGTHSLLWNHKREISGLTPCPECGSTLGIYTVLALPSLWSDDAERRQRRNSPIQAGDFGPCKNCFNGLIYDAPSGSLRLRRVSRDEIMNSKIISPGQLPMRRDDPTAHVAKDWEAVLMVYGLDMTVETPEKNQQAPFMEALGEASRLLPKDAVTEYVSASAFLSFEDWRELYLGLFSNSLDEDKRKVLLSVTVKPGVTITPQMEKHRQHLLDDVLPVWRASRRQVALNLAHSSVAEGGAQANRK